MLFKCYLNVKIEINIKDIFFIKMIDIDTAWDDFCDGNYTEDKNIKENNINDREKDNYTNLYISTKTKMLYLNNSIDLDKLFWDVEVIPYYKSEEGIIKKQMKFSSNNQSELDIITNKLDKYSDIMTESQIIKQIINASGRIKFKDIRKITIGLSKKDIISYRKKKKGAFINCFILMMRVFIDMTYKEIHVKVFNTGKIEIPGIQNDKDLIIIMRLLINTLNKYDKKITHYLKDKTDTILINSNFSCGFYINRNKLYELLKNKYNINSSFDPCSYPGIQSEFYYDLEKDNTGEIQNGKQKLNNNNVIKTSFMIFRTGSILIVGKCNEKILNVIYEFIKNILINEKTEIFDGINNDIKIKNKKTSKFVKKITTIL